MPRPCAASCIPQVWPRILPPLSNETITLVKDTSLIYVLALNDLLRAARGIVQRDFTTTPFIVAACFYLADDLGVDLGLPVPGETLCQKEVTPDVHDVAPKASTRPLARNAGAERCIAGFAAPG